MNFEKNARLGLTVASSSNFILDEEGLPIQFFHGTSAQFDAFDTRKNEHGIIFFSTERVFAEEWVLDRNCENDANVITCLLAPCNPWDYKNQVHLDLLLTNIQKRGIEISDPDWFSEAIVDGDWLAIERTPGVLEILRDLGHDAIFMTEGSDMDRNIGVLDPSVISIQSWEPLKKQSRNSIRP